jgi:DNA-binding MarR family transcriptional regulator
LHNEYFESESKTSTVSKVASTRARSDSIQGVEESLDELSSLLWETVRGLKQASPPPRELLEAATRESLGPRHMPAVLAVAAAGPLSVSELARRLGLGLSTTSAIVGQLSRAGLLERAEDEADRRRTIVRLNDKDREVIGGWAEQAIAPLRGTLERLSPEARAQFMEGWRILHEEATRSATSSEECDAEGGP